MPNFRYKARDRFGKATQGVISGANSNEVASHLNSMGYTPISIESTKDFGFGSGALGMFGFFDKITQGDINMFTRQLFTLQKSGIPLLSSLDTLEKQTTNKRFKDVLKEISAHVEKGSSLSEAMAKFPRVFNDFYVNAIKSGEAGGILDDVLSRLSDLGEKEQDNAARVKAAIRYPLMTFAALIVAFIVMVTFVIPKFENIFSQFKSELPLPTRMLLALSSILKNYWFIVLILLAAIIFLFIKIINTKNGRLKWDSFKLKIPVFGRLSSMFAMSRFTRTMAVLLRSGVPILQVLDMSSRSCGNAVIARAIDNIASSVREGKGLAEPMQFAGLFPPIVINMVATGEETGKLDELLMGVADYYDRESDYMVKNLSSYIEPLFIVILGAMVLLMALALFLPMWNMIKVFKH